MSKLTCTSPRHGPLTKFFSWRGQRGKREIRPPPNFPKFLRTQQCLLIDKTKANQASWKLKIHVKTCVRSSLSELASAVSQSCLNLHHLHPMRNQLNCLLQHLHLALRRCSNTIPMPSIGQSQHVKLPDSVVGTYKWLHY